MLDETGFDSKRRSRSLNFPDQQSEDARLAKRLKALFTADMLNTAGADAAARPPQPAEPQSGQVAAGSNAAACAAQDVTQRIQGQALAHSSASNPQTPAASSAVVVQSLHVGTRADVYAAAPHITCEPAVCAEASQRAPIRSGCQQRYQQDGTARAQPQGVWAGSWQQQQQRHPGGVDDVAAAVFQGQAQQLQLQAGCTQGLPDPCDLPLVPVDMLNDADWQDLLAAVGTGAAGTAAVAPASQMAHTAGSISTAPSAAAADSVAAAQILPLLSHDQHQGVLSLFDMGYSGQGMQAADLAAAAAANAAAQEHNLLAHRRCDNRQGQTLRALASAVPAAAVPAAAGMLSGAAFAPILTVPVLPACESGAAQGAHALVQSPGTPAQWPRSSGSGMGWLGDMQGPVSAAGAGVGAATYTPASTGLLSCVTTPTPAGPAGGRAGSTDLAGRVKLLAAAVPTIRDG